MYVFGRVLGHRHGYHELLYVYTIHNTQYIIHNTLYIVYSTFVHVSWKWNSGVGTGGPWGFWKICFDDHCFIIQQSTTSLVRPNVDITLIDTVSPFISCKTCYFFNYIYNQCIIVYDLFVSVILVLLKSCLQSPDLSQVLAYPVLGCAPLEWNLKNLHFKASKNTRLNLHILFFPALTVYPRLQLNGIKTVKLARIKSLRKKFKK